LKRLLRLVLFTVTGCFLIQLALSSWAADTKNLKAGELKSPSGTVEAKGVTKSAKPDLVVSKINFSPGNPMVDAEITLWIFVKNVGQARADAFDVRVQVGGESNPPVIPVPGLNPNQEFRYTRTTAFDRTGNYIVTVTADAGNVLVESNEGNNVKKATIKVKPRPKPDLVVTKINFSPGKPKAHEHITYWVFVKNNGPGYAQTCYLSITDSMNAYSIWSRVLVPALDPGREWRFEGPRQYNQAGTYTLKAVIDRENRIDETNEENNVLLRDIVVAAPSN
jgi:subtilase family serine protease